MISIRTKINKTNAALVAIRILYIILYIIKPDEDNNCSGKIFTIDESRRRHCLNKL